MFASKGWTRKSYDTHYHGITWTAIQCARNAILDRSRYVRIELLERYHALKGVLNIGIDFQHFDWMPVAAKETTRNEATINTSRDSEFKEHLMWSTAGCHCNLSMYPVKDQCFMSASCYFLIFFVLVGFGKTVPFGPFYIKEINFPKHHPNSK